MEFLGIKKLILKSLERPIQKIPDDIVQVLMSIIDTRNEKG